MKYFVKNDERVNTVYHEFQKGHFDNKTFWKDDSICLSDDLFLMLGVEDLFFRTIPNYTDTGENEINFRIWEEIKMEAVKMGGNIQECIAEADEWVRKMFQEYEFFTIIGV